MKLIDCWHCSFKHKAFVLAKVLLALHTYLIRQPEYLRSNRLHAEGVSCKAYSYSDASRQSMRGNSQCAPREKTPQHNCATQLHIRRTFKTESAPYWLGEPRMPKYLAAI